MIPLEVDILMINKRRSLENRNEQCRNRTVDQFFFLKEIFRIIRGLKDVRD